MNDRWLFLAAFLLLLFLCGVVIRWLVKHLESVMADHKALVTAQNETALKLVVCIDRNTATLQDCKLELRRVREAKPLAYAE